MARKMMMFIHNTCAMRNVPQGQGARRNVETNGGKP